MYPRTVIALGFALLVASCGGGGGGGGSGDAAAGAPVGAASTNAAPTAILTSPVAGTQFQAPASITLNASATDADGTIAKVEFFNGTTKLGEASTAPYRFTWSNVAVGNYSITALATDNTGAQQRSTAIDIVVLPDQRATIGAWSPVFFWPDVAINMNLLPDGKVLTYADDDHDAYPINKTRAAGTTRVFVVDVPQGGTNISWTEWPHTRTNLFCSGHAFLPDGRLLIVGGHNGVDFVGVTHTATFDNTQSNPWNYALPDMQRGRWYPTATSLANGDVLVLSGTVNAENDPNDLPEVWQTSSSSWRALTNARKPLRLYPTIHVAPNGFAFMSGPDRETLYLDTSGPGQWQAPLAFRATGYSDYGSSVMYEPGKVMFVGGGRPPTGITELIDLNAGTPSWRTSAPMAFARRHHNATILPDGTVLVTGGTATNEFNDATNSIFPAELWNPAAETWTTLASMQVPRVYHSTALLLPDGRVLSAGGGRPAAVNGEDYENAEIYSPPYLFKGARPTIDSVPASVGYNSGLDITTPDGASIQSVTLVRLSSVTHAFNMNQRFNRLSFTRTANGVRATTPANANLAPPGHYMLFILNAQGVPSVARVVQLI